MNLRQLEKIDEYRWTVPLKKDEQRAPVILFGTPLLLQSMDEKVLEQITNVARLPGLVGPAMAMPDAHWGYGFPIGGVAAFDPKNGIVSAGGVGFDISCGVRCLRTQLNFKDISSRLAALAERIFRIVPAGVGEEGHLKLPPRELDDVLEGGARWAVDSGMGVPEDLEYVEEGGCVPGAVPSCVSDLAKQRQRGEMGTLGSGNHYLEIQVVEHIYDQPAAEAFGLHEGQVVVSIHCGSRGLGHQVGTDYLVSLAKAASRLGIKLPERELACAPIASPEGQDYLGAMIAASNCALANRQIITHLTRQAFDHVVPNAQIETLFDTSHNICKVERHNVGGEMRTLYVHRKGATRAFGPGHPDLPPRYKDAGQPVIIGGTMGTASYVLAGVAPASLPAGTKAGVIPENEAFSSACHGAGRAMSRNQALKRWQGKKVIEDLKSQGILIRAHSNRGAAEEAPGAYKDVEEVAEATERAQLAKRVARLVPKACIKG
ncbi:MAG TPA: RtcB family protein [Planctomycetota bacterium]|jgi:tRNA-splicing ligase RtcB